MKKNYRKLSYSGFALLLFFAFTSFVTSNSDYKITIVNKNWNNLHLQVRVGNQSIPENNPLVKDVFLKKGESVIIDYDVLCYYRRDANPDQPDNKTFTTWTSAGCFRNTPCVEENP